jgi:hypothetical protein
MKRRGNGAATSPRACGARTMLIEASGEG